MTACDSCLRRAYLVGQLAARIAGLLDRPGRRARALLSLDDEELVAAVAGDRTAELRRWHARFRPGRARTELHESRIVGICRHDDGYPAGLRDLPDAPATVFASGHAELLARVEVDPAVTIVGTRRPAPYGVEMAYSLGGGLAAAGVNVVSGLAFGIDAAAHRGCLDARAAPPLAVVAGGPELPYPRRHRRLFEGVRTEGVVVSEMPPGQRPFRWSFPARNRLMAALGRMTVVVEAADPSGSLITAEFAQDLGRTVGAVPGRATARTAAGTNALLRDGAALVRSPKDVLEELFGAGARPTPPVGRLPEDPTLVRVLSALEQAEGVGAVARTAGLSARATRAALTRLELDGHVARDHFGCYRRTAS